MRTGKPGMTNHSPLARREFLRLGVGGSLALVASPGSSLMGETVFQSDKVRTPAPFEFEEVTIGDLVDGMASGKFSARSIAEKFIERIEEIDKQGPMLNSVIELNPEALQIADELDRERKEKGARGPLHGIPVVLKDNIDTADRMHTTAGSLALLESKPPADAFLVHRLRAAGAVILGKTNLSEWANIRSTHSTSGWSGRGGLTKNPYALDRNTSGSSSGSAVAVASSLCAVAVGTETDGSIVSPSSINGIVGIKPTVGLVSRTGIVPISHSQDSAGPMARTVRDAAILLGAMVGTDKADAATSANPSRKAEDYTQYLDPHGLRGARIGVVRKYFGFLDRVDAVINSAVAALKSEGAILVDPVEIEAVGKMDDAETTVLLYELKADMKAYLSRLGEGAPAHTLKDLIEYNETHAKTEMPYFGQELFIRAEAKGPLTSKEYLNALAKNHRLSREKGIDGVMKKYKLDALVAPTDGPAWMTDLVCGDHFLGGSSNLAAVAGYPSVTVPAGFVFGLPVGISFFGRAWSEPTLIKLAFAYEQATKVRKPPTYVSTADLQLT
ncbi:MAG: amidase [Bacteroidota bacterium]